MATSNVRYIDEWPEGVLIAGANETDVHRLIRKLSARLGDVELREFPPSEGRGCCRARAWYGESHHAAEADNWEEFLVMCGEDFADNHPSLNRSLTEVLRDGKPIRACDFEAEEINWRNAAWGNGLED